MAKRPLVQTARFELRCSPEELAGWRAAAHGHGTPLAQYIRDCLTKGNVFLPKMPTDPALIRQIAAIGNNLNQITRWANAHKSEAEARPVEEEVRRTREALEALARMEERPC